MKLKTPAESTTIEEAKLLVAAAFSAHGLQPPVWRVSETSVTPWEYTDICTGGYKDFSVGASAGGVVSIDGSSFTPGERKLNVTFDRVLFSLQTKMASLGLDPSAVTTNEALS